MTQNGKRSFIMRLRVFLALLAIPLIASAANNCLSRNASRSQQNSNVVVAEQEFAEGQRLLTEGTALSQRNAIEKFTEAARLWRLIGDKRKEAIALSFIGKVYDLLSEKQKALDFYIQTLSLVRVVGDRASEAATLNNIGLIYDSLGGKQKALDYYNSSASITRRRLTYRASVGQQMHHCRPTVTLLRLCMAAGGNLK